MIILMPMMLMTTLKKLLILKVEAPKQVIKMMLVLMLGAVKMTMAKVIVVTIDA